MTTATMESATLNATKAEADDGYPVLEALIQGLGATAAQSHGPLFTTDAGERTEAYLRPAEEGGGTAERTVTDLYDVFLANLPEERRQHYNCNCCRRFVNRYGGLVGLREDGTTIPVFWPVERLEAGPVFAPVIAALHGTVSRAKVTGVFLSFEEAWGTPYNDPGSGSKYLGRRWTHLSCPSPAVFKHKLLTADQRTAELKQDYELLCRTLAETPLAAAAEAVRVLEADAVGRADKALGAAKWFRDLRMVWEATRGREKTNRLWLAVANAPPGYAHARNTMLGTLLDDIVAGLGFEEVKARWHAKMHPLRYQRPTALKAGNLEVAEKLIEKLGAAKSLERRYARLEEVKQYAYWTPAPAAGPSQGGGVFTHLKATAGKAKAEVKPLELPAKTLTWSRFRTEVLPTAAKIEYLIPHGLQPFTCLVTAVHPDAPPILQWDGLTGVYIESHKFPNSEAVVPGATTEVTLRNPVSWYFRAHGAPAYQWNLTAGSRVEVTAVLPFPHEWQRPELFEHHGRGVVFLLAGARDVANPKGGGLFPECLRAEFREARAAIEAYTNNAEIAGREEADANGLAWGRGNQRSWECELRVTDAAGAVANYKLDRWD